MKKKIWIPTVAGAILIFGTAANMSNNPSQSPSDDSVVINDWLIVGEPHPAPFTPGEGAFMSGAFNVASGNSSIAIGRWNQATYFSSIALGVNNYSMGQFSAAIGGLNYASGYASVALGSYAVSSGRSSISMGRFIEATGNDAIAMGSSISAHGRSTIVVGKYNESILANSSDSPYQDNADGHLFVIGNGSANNDRSNAMVVYHNGTIDIGKNDADDTVPLKVTADGSVILAKEQGDISMGAFGISGN